MIAALSTETTTLSTILCRRRSTITGTIRFADPISLSKTPKKFESPTDLSCHTPKRIKWSGEIVIVVPDRQTMFTNATALRAGARLSRPRLILTCAISQNSIEPRRRPQTQRSEVLSIV